MIAELEKKRAAVVELCHRHGVERLEVFGSAARGEGAAAVERKFEIIGEALGHAAREAPALVNAIPEIPRVIGLRNRLIHGYESVDDQIIWDLVQHKLPDLAKAVSELLTQTDQAE